MKLLFKCKISILIIIFFFPLFSQGWAQQRDKIVKSDSASLQFKIKEVRFEGSQIYSSEFLSFLVKVKKRFKSSKLLINKDVLRLKRTGFFKNVSFEEKIISKKGIITFHLLDKSSQPIYRIGKLTVVGNKKTKEKVILREFNIKKGNIFLWRQLLPGLQRLKKFRIFKKVSIRIEPQKDTTVNIVIEVEEGMTQIGFIWPTYSTDNPDLGGFGPVGGYVNINLLGSASWIGFGGMWAKNRVAIAGMAFPRFLKKGQLLTFGLGYGEREQESYSNDLIKTGGKYKIIVNGGLFYLTTPLKYNLKMINFFGIFKTNFEQINGKLPSENAWGPLYSFTLAYDSRDDELETTRGLYPGLRFDTGYYIGKDGKKSFYIRYNPTFRGYFRIGPRHCIALQVRGGVTNRNAPYLAKYQLGGSNDLRGFPEWSIVGNNYFLANIEYRFPIFSFHSNYGISGVLFYDIGQAWDVGEKSILDSAYNSKGIGLRFLTGPIILRLDYGHSQKNDAFYFFFNQLF